MFQLSCDVTGGYGSAAGKSASRNLIRVLRLLPLLLLPDALAAQTARPAGRVVAITFDDLPAVSTRSDYSVQAGITDGIVSTLTRNTVPAIGFVNEGKLYDGERLDSARLGLLRRWLDAGFELGNHTYSHRSLFNTPLATFQADVLRGERLTRPLMREYGRTLRWFRHPTLNTGPDLATRAAFESFLTRNAYAVAPVTIDNQEWIFARAWDIAADRADNALRDRIEDDYLTYMDTIFGYYEQQSRDLLGYELPQILLLHANRLNAACLDRLLAMMRRRGYGFVTMAEALRDPAWSREDRYAGSAGITWLHRWALTEGRKGAFFAGEPDLPRYVHELTGLE